MWTAGSYFMNYRFRKSKKHLGPQCSWQCLYSRLVILEGPEFNFTAVQKLFQKSKSCSRPYLFHILNSPYTKDHLLGLRCANFVHKVENRQKKPDMLCLICKFKSNCRLSFTFPYQARALRALGLLLADGAPTVGRGKTF